MEGAELALWRFVPDADICDCISFSDDFPTTEILPIATIVISPMGLLDLMMIGETDPWKSFVKLIFLFL
jgi:hypothetical protein